NKPLGSATIVLRGTKTAVLSGNDGAFTFKNILPGNYTIEISNIGFHSMEKEVSVRAGSVTEISIQLPGVETELSEVIVSAGRTKETIDEVPSSVTIVGLKTIEQNIQMTTNL